AVAYGGRGIAQDPVVLRIRVEVGPLRIPGLGRVVLADAGHEAQRVGPSRGLQDLGLVAGIVHVAGRHASSGLAGAGAVAVVVVGVGRRVEAGARRLREEAVQSVVGEGLGGAGDAVGVDLGQAVAGIVVRIRVLAEDRAGAAGLVLDLGQAVGGVVGPAGV